MILQKQWRGKNGYIGKSCETKIFFTHRLRLFILLYSSTANAVILKLLFFSYLFKTHTPMKKFYLFLSFVMVTLVQLSAQRRSGDYYIDFNGTDEKFYFEYVDGQYIANVAKVSSEFKIYSSQYDGQSSNQDQYIFGAADGQGGITPDSEKKLSHPGNMLSIEGGGTIYGATFIFDPDKMTLTIQGGSTTPVDPAVELIINSAAATSTESGTINFTVAYVATDDYPTPSEFVVTAYYTTYNGDSNEVSTTVTSSSMSSSLSLDQLVPAETNLIELEVKCTSNGKDLSASTTAPIVTPGLPILIGQISGHEWDPSYGIEGTVFTKIADGKTYYYTVDLTDDGEFSFVTKLGTSSSDWTTVDSYPRYAPSSNRVAAPNKTWMPYTVFTNGTSNAWYPENFEPGTYTVEFDETRQAIAVVRGDTPTGVDDVSVESAPATVDVYSISGVRVRQNVSAADATAGLPSGLYIVAGKKIAVR